MSDITVIQMFATLTAAVTDSIANIDIPTNGRLIGVDWSMQVIGLSAEGDVANLELAFIATNQRTTNDARGTVSAVKAAANEATPGGIGAVAKYVDLRPGVKVSAGERLYLHGQASTGVTINGIILVQFDFGSPRRAAVRRR